MSSYITPGTKFPNYYQFPEFLIRAPLSQTAKLAYMVLYDRARLSQKNGWIKDAGIYIVYPIKDMAETLGRSESTVKSAYNELSSLGLLIRKDGGFSKANVLYVLLPEQGQFSEPMRKSAAIRSEINTDSGSVSGPAGGSFPPPNKIIETNNNTQNNRVYPRSAFGRYKNVYLSQDEYKSLKADLPYKADALIEEMSAYCEANGKSYRNFDAAIRCWAAKEKREQKPKSGFEDYSFKPGQSY